MKYFTEISLFFIVFFIFPNNMEALVAPKASPITVESVFELDRNDLVQLDRKALQQKIGRKLKFKERIALKLVKRKLRKYPNASGEEAAEATKVNGMAIVGFIFGLVSLFFAGIILGILGVIISGGALNNIKMNPGMGGRGLAIAGLALGIIGVLGALLIMASLL